MPFRSKAQARFMFAAEGRGDIAKGTAERFAHHTPGGIKSLPNYAGTKPRRMKGGRRPLHAHYAPKH